MEQYSLRRHGDVDPEEPRERLLWLRELWWSIRHLSAVARWIALAVVAVIAAGCAARYYFGPRSVTVSVFTDSVFRNRPNWKALVESRFEKATAIFAPAKVLWKVTSADSADPTLPTMIPGFDGRRRALTNVPGYPADVLVLISGRPNGDPLGETNGSVKAFAHAILVADFRDRSEEQNVAVLVHQLARLFGAVDDPNVSGAGLGDRDATLIRRLRRYNFAAGLDGLQGSWDGQAVAALVDAGTGLFDNPIFHAHDLIADSMLDAGNQEGSVRHLREAIHAYSANAKVRFELGVALAGSSPDEAIQQLRQAERLAPNDYLIHHELGIQMQNKNRLGEALIEFQAAAEAQPHSPDAYFDLGLVAQQTEDLEAAAAAFRKALAIDANYGLAHVGMAVVDYKRKDYKAAWEEIRGARSSGIMPPQKLLNALNASMPEPAAPE